MTATDQDWEIGRWAEPIDAAWRSGVESSFETGRLLVEAKEALQHGAFETMISEVLPFGPRTARCLMAIARDDRLANRNPGSVLPPSWRTLYELTKLDDDVLEEKFADGTIHPEMKRSDLLLGLKRKRRAEREHRLGGRIRSEAARLAAMPRSYGVILADPGWRFDAWNDETGMDRAADNHYPTAAGEELGALIPPAANDSALFLWSPAAQLVEALWLMQAWDFSYRSHIAWAKPRAGTGYWVRTRHELLLIGARGKIPAPAPGEQPDSVIEAPQGRHSEKPAIFHDIIERMFPSLPRLEMFARASRPGWDAWGAEAPA